MRDQKQKKLTFVLTIDIKRKGPSKGESLANVKDERSQLRNIDVLISQQSLLTGQVYRRCCYD